MKKRTSSRILRAAVSLCLVFALFCTMGMMAFAQADDALGTIREAERRAYEEAQRQKEEDNQRVLREMERKSAWREHLPPVVHTEQDELDARALYYSNREREIFRRGRALRC